MKEQSMRFQEWFVYLLEVSGYLPWILNQEGKHELLEDLNAFFREIKNMTTHDPAFDLKRCIEMIELLEAFQIRVEPISIARSEDHVILTTAHKAKGREWDYVFVPGFTTSWDKREHTRVSLVPQEVLAETPLDKKEELEDSRRLIYVMLTRAKKEFYISSPEILDITGQNKVAQRSAFCSELPADYIDHLQSPGVTIQEENDILTAALTRSPSTMWAASAFEEYVHVRCSHIVINSTNFNRYISSPLEFVLFDVLQVPRALTTAQIVGSAIHEALENWYTAPPTTRAHKVMKAYNYLLKQGVGQQEASRWKGDMDEMLERFEILDSTVGRIPTYTEMILGSKHMPLHLGKIPLSGRLDRIDMLDTKTAQVIDYKTSRDKSENEIRALRQSDLDPTEKQFSGIKGPLYRQLLFYKLLLGLHPTRPHHVESGAFWFLGPTQSTKSRPRILTLPDEHINELKEHIQIMYKTIRDPVFIRTIPWELEALQLSHGLVNH
ncbi:MAG: ATP-dependent DNA helicase UvrD1 [Microgenomates bacterium OLB22]|nr:MAG: ATP-dependent DNA helicase UvrD1 [Microgenomates bacterium OLB22]